MEVLTMADATGRPPGPSSPDPAPRAPTQVLEHIEAAERRPGDRVELLGAYTELAWASTLGPTAVLLARRLDRLARAFPAGTDVQLGELAASLGVRPARVVVAFDRLAEWGIIERRGSGVAVSGFAPLIPSGQLGRLPASTLSAHLALTTPGQRSEESRPAMSADADPHGGYSSRDRAAPRSPQNPASRPESER